MCIRDRDMGLYESNYIHSNIRISGNQKPASFQLMQNYPNPFNPSTTIEYSVGTGKQALTHVDLTIFNILGEKIATLISASQPVGTYQVTWDASELPSGVYFYRLQSGNFVQTRRMLLIK